MKITVKRSGGFAGIEEILVDLDTEQLEESDAENVGLMIEETGLLEEPASISAETIGADLQHYEIEIVDGETEYRIEFDDDGSDETTLLRKLVDTLRNLMQA